MSNTYDIDRLVDEQRIDRFNILVVFWSFLAMLADGYELSAMAFAGPELVRDWGIEPSALGIVLSASLFGILFGAPLLGYVGDRFGRRIAILAGLVLCGASTLAMAWSTNLEQMFVLRFIAGIGIGGLMPNTIALTSELSPRRHRAMMIVIMFVGITVGGGSPSIIAAKLVPDFGWQVLFLVGGVVPLVIAGCLAFVLPESVKFLATRPGEEPRLRAIVQRMRRDIELPADASFRLAGTDEPAHAGGMGQIFAGGLQLITPLLWFCFAATLMANFFLNSWTPVLFERTGMTPEEAAFASGLYHVGGTLGGILISVLIDRYGVLVIAIFLGLAAPAVAAIGIPSMSHGAIELLSLVAGVCVLGAQFGNNAAAGLIYPTRIRAKAVGFAFSIGRFGSILGPLLGGYVIAKKFTLAQMFQVAAIPLLLAAIAAMILTRVCWLRYSGFQLDDKPAGGGPVADRASESA